MEPYYNQTTKETAKIFNVDPEKGLSDHEVEKRRNEYGANAIKVKETPLWKKIIAPFTDLLMIILVIALVISAVQGNWYETVVIFFVIGSDAAIYYFQRFSTERILKSLKTSMVQSIAVRREGEERYIDATELVPGDIVILREGDRVPADGRIISESGLLTNESMLTGESEAIAKDAKAISGPKKVYEQRNMVFSGSFVITGTGIFIATATGNATEYGRIASLASSLGEEPPIEQKMNKLVSLIAIAVVSLAVLILIVQLMDGIEIVEALEFTLAMMVSAIPEDLPIASSIILALCAKRMAKKNALVKELQAIESVGIVTTIASDKTGTLTENRLMLRELWSPTLKTRELTDALAASVIPSSAALGAAAVDPLDSCISGYLSDKNYPYDKNEPSHSYAFDQDVKLSGNLFKTPEGKLILRLKGAPETILARSEMKNKDRITTEEKLMSLAGSGYKVLALAHAEITHEINELVRLDKSTKLCFDGLFAVADALRPEAAAAIRQAAKMGVKTKMVTGDHAGTSYAIGRELGLVRDPSEVLDCSRLGNISDDDLAERVAAASVFARVTPEDKYRILSAIKRNEICAMTGDGVNDVPALVGAHVGIAMGDSPSIVQDAADLVLVDNNFKNITEAIKESRTVLANIRRMLCYLLATNAGEAITMLIALAFSGHQLLTPIQILWVNLVTDSFMSIPIGLEPPEQKILQGKPEHKDAPILSGKFLGRMVIMSLTMAVVTLTTYYLSFALLQDHDMANTLAFTALVVMQWASALSVRGLYESAFQRMKVSHPFFTISFLCAVTLHFLALFTPLGNIVGIVAVPPVMLVATLTFAFVIPFAIFEIAKKKLR